MTCVNAIGRAASNNCPECIDKRRAEGRYINWKPTELYTAYEKLQAVVDAAKPINTELLNIIEFLGYMPNHIIISGKFLERLSGALQKLEEEKK